MLDEEARNTLEKNGMMRLGSSVWIDDQGWWGGSAIFQASRWDDKFYLNVGPHWYWNLGDKLERDVGKRIDGIELYHVDDPQEQKRLTQTFVRMAAAKVAELKAAINTPADAAHILKSSIEAGAAIPAFDAGVALAVSGNTHEAREMFDRFTAWFQNETVRFARSNSYYTVRFERVLVWRKLLNSPSELHKEILDTIVTERRRLRLPVRDQGLILIQGN
jgi:hypothetical protein